jgi:hypothetical protein
MVDLIVLEFERENGYRHPPFVHCNIIIHPGAREEQAEHLWRDLMYRLD